MAIWEGGYLGSRHGAAETQCRALLLYFLLLPLDLLHFCFFCKKGLLVSPQLRESILALFHLRWAANADVSATDLKCKPSMRNDQSDSLREVTSGLPDFTARSEACGTVTDTGLRQRKTSIAP